MKTCPIIYKPANEQDRKEFIEWLKRCGYIPFAYDVDDDNQVTTFCDTRPWYTSCTHNGPVNDIDNPVDCGSNLPLAKALAALDDENDYRQYFIHNFHKSFMVSYENNPPQRFKEVYTKATKDELIEKFKN